MFNFFDQFKFIFNIFKISFLNFTLRWKQGFGELIPQAFFYLTQTVVVFSLFQNINGVEIAKPQLIHFLLLLFAIDSLNDAILYKGLFEYLINLRKGQTFYYILGPGSPLLKVIFLRVELPMFFQGVIFTLLYLCYACYNQFLSLQNQNILSSFDTTQLVTILILNTFLLFILLIFGVIVNLVLSSAYFIIQSYFDPLIPIPLGSPATRYYTRPLQLILQNSALLFGLKWIYPAYFITGYSSEIVYNSNTWLDVFLTLIGLMGVLYVWVRFLNALVIKSCQKYQN